MTARNPVRAKDRQHQSRFTRPILFVFPTSGTCSCGVAPRDNVLRASAEPRAVWINSLFVASRRVVRLLVFEADRVHSVYALSLNLGNPAAPNALKHRQEIVSPLKVFTESDI